MTKTFCDRCEKEVSKTNLRVETWNGEIIPNTVGGENWKRKILCEPCFTALELFLNNK